MELGKNISDSATCWLLFFFFFYFLFFSFYSKAIHVCNLFFFVSNINNNNYTLFSISIPLSNWHPYSHFTTIHVTYNAIYYMWDRCCFYVLYCEPYGLGGLNKMTTCVLGIHYLHKTYKMVYLCSTPCILSKHKRTELYLLLLGSTIDGYINVNRRESILFSILFKSVLHL